MSGIKKFDLKKITFLATNWSKQIIKCCQLQKRCACLEIMPICCPGGWTLILCNSRYMSPTEDRYSPVEGEALAGAWSFKNAQYFVLGCENLVDHKLLLGILKDKYLKDIENPRLVNLKEKTLSYKFQIVHVPRVKNRVADTSSSFPTGLPKHMELAALQEGGEMERLSTAVIQVRRHDPDEEEIMEGEAGGSCQYSTGVISGGTGESRN